MDTDSSDCYVDKKFVEKNYFPVQNYMGEATLVETSIKIPITSRCLVNLEIENNEYGNIPFRILNNLSTDIINLKEF